MHQCVSDYMWPLLQYSPVLTNLCPVVILRFTSFHHFHHYLIIIILLPIFIFSVFLISLSFLFFVTLNMWLLSSVFYSLCFLLNLNPTTHLSLWLIRIATARQKGSYGPGNCAEISYSAFRQQIHFALLVESYCSHPSCFQPLPAFKKKTRCMLTETVDRQCEPL